MKGLAQNIPESLIYEMVKGKPIYYKGYKDFLKGRKKIEELMGSSKLQSLIIAELIFLLRTFFGDDYLIFTNEIGLQFSKKSWRAADIAIIKSKKVKNIDNKYLQVAPEIVIEIDTKAELVDIKNPLGYYQEKTDELMKFGVKKVIWIFTETQKVMIADPKNQWTIHHWEDDTIVAKGLKINIAEIIRKRS